MLALVVACLYGTLSGTESLMKILPVFEEARCSVCHQSSNPVPGDYTLNPFGSDFLANGSRWDATLADKDSDSDGYRNGDELGDPDGDGTTDVDFVRSNPGDPDDKPSSIDEKTWGVIKQLFADE
ncbi:MAG: hypothetical protein GF417_02810 [Candidatus Latescibacteria bacterium]|nr:hypothetical protein [bacterium]MBD3423360.1 hypothetical protein [Candidatus Latescibacterota bacterium]